MAYLSYDIRGIQRFIFAVPNLRCIIGGSSLIADFDKQVRVEFAEQVIYVGGGSGMLRLKDPSSHEGAQAFLNTKARAIGVDLRIGQGTTFSEAKINDQLFTFVPDSLAGLPCAMSGLLPVDPNDETTQWKKVDKRVHRLIGERREASNTDRLSVDLLTEIRAKLQTDVSGYGLQFFRNVNIGSAEKNEQVGWEDNEKLAKAGSAALGSRNRWAVIAMDGNDAGQQHQTAQRKVDENKWTEVFRDKWVRRMSAELSDATRQAFLHAAAELIDEWLDHQRPPETSSFMVDSRDSNDSTGKAIVLPIRPLIIGGDDVILLCHTAHAITFVRAMSAKFSELCRQAGQQFQSKHQHELWPASGNELTISAGVLFVKNSYPLHAAITYAENLLGSAKGKFRQKNTVKQPMPAAIDFDIVTDTLLDSPAARRRRELEFFDADISQRVRLTERPYRLQPCDGERSLDDLDQLCRDTMAPAKMPGSTAAALMQSLTRPWAERVQFLASLSRKYPELYAAFNEEDAEHPGNGWRPIPGGEQSGRQTHLIDAILLREESRRDDQITAGVQGTPHGDQQ